MSKAAGRDQQLRHGCACSCRAAADRRPLTSAAHGKALHDDSAARPNHGLAARSAGDALRSAWGARGFAAIGEPGLRPNRRIDIREADVVADQDALRTKA